MNRNLRGTDIGDALAVPAKAEKLFTPPELKVFDALPADEINTRIDETFVAMAPAPEVPASAEAWKSTVTEWRKTMEAKSFQGWPAGQVPGGIERTFREEKDGVRLERYQRRPESGVTNSLYVIHRAGLEWKDLDLLVLNVLREEDWADFLAQIPSQFPAAFEGIPMPPVNQEQLGAERQMHQSFKWGMAYLCTRGVGPHRWTTDAKKAGQIERRFALIGQTSDGMRVWDIRQAISAIRAGGLGEKPLWLQAAGPMAGNAIYAAIWSERPVARLDLHDVPVTHRDGPIYLNVLKISDLPFALTVAAEQTPVRLYTRRPEDWSYLTRTAQALAWPAKQVDLRAARGE
jgi:hypothetical protein